MLVDWTVAIGGEEEEEEDRKEGKSLLANSLVKNKWITVETTFPSASQIRSMLQFIELSGIRGKEIIPAPSDQINASETNYQLLTVDIWLQDLDWTEKTRSFSISVSSFFKYSFWWIPIIVCQILRKIQSLAASF